MPVFILYAALALCVGSGHQCVGVLANAWHIPNNTSDLGFNMRNPEFEIGASTSTSDQATAAGSPFTIRNRPAWLFHKGSSVSYRRSGQVRIPSEALVNTCE